MYAGDCVLSKWLSVYLYGCKSLVNAELQSRCLQSGGLVVRLAVRLKTRTDVRRSIDCVC